MKQRNIVQQVTWRYLWKNKRQTLISYIGIVLMVLLMTCVFTGRDTMISYMTSITEHHYGKWHMAVYDVNGQQYEELRQKEYVEQVAVSRNQQWSNFPQSAKATRPFLNLREYSQQGFDLQNVTLVEGRLPKNDKELVLSIEAVKDGSSIKIGDRITVDAYKRLIENTGSGPTIFPFINLTLEAGKTTEVPLSFPFFAADDDFFKGHREIHEPTNFHQTYTVVGFIQAPNFELSGNAAYTGLTLLNPDKENLASQPFNLSFRISKNHPREATFIREELEKMGLSTIDTNNEVLAVSSLSSDPTINGLVIAVQGFFISLIALVSIILIYNIFNLSYDERARYLAMLTSVGATKKQKRRSIYFEVLVLLGAALPLGFLLALGIIYVSIQVMLPALMASITGSPIGNLPAVPFQFDISIWSLLLIVVFSTGTVFVSAFLPARKISRVGTIDTLRGNQNLPKRKKKTKTRLGQYRPELLLAQGFLSYQKNKSRGIVRALSAFIMILLVVSYGGHAVIRMVQFKLSDNVTLALPYMEQSDYSISGIGTSSSQVEAMREKLLKTKGISHLKTSYTLMWGAQTDSAVYSSEYQEAQYKVLREYFPKGWSREDMKQFMAERPRFISFLAVDDAIFDQMIHKVKGRIAPTSTLPLLIYQTMELSTDKMRVANQEARQYQFFEVNPATNLKLGASLPLTYIDEEKSQAAGQTVYQSLDGQIAGLGTADDLAEWLTVHSESMWVITRNAAFTELVKQLQSDYQITLSFQADEKEAGVAQILQELRQLENHEIAFTSRQTKKNSDFKVLIANLIQFVMLAFISLTSLICGLNLYNSISGLLITRQRNFVILKSLGMTRTQISRMVRWEFYVIFLYSILWALPFTGLACWLIQSLFVQRFGYFEIGFPLTSFLIILAVFGLIVGLLHWFCQKKTKDSLMEGIRRELV